MKQNWVIGTCRIIYVQETTMKTGRKHNSSGKREKRNLYKSKEMSLYKKHFLGVWFLIAEAIGEDNFWNYIAN